MGNQIIRQPDGQFALFNSNANTIIVWDVTAEAVVEWFVERAARDAREQVLRTLSHVEAGEPRKAYHQFAMTWEEALAEDRAHGGDAYLHFRVNE